MRERSREESRTKTKEMSQETTTTKRIAGEEIIFKEREPSSMKKQERQTQDSHYRTLRQWNKDTITTQRRAEEVTTFKERESKPRTSREPSSMKKEERQTQDLPYRTPRQWNKDTTNFRRERMQTSST